MHFFCTLTYPDVFSNSSFILKSSQSLYKSVSARRNTKTGTWHLVYQALQMVLCVPELRIYLLRAVRGLNERLVVRERKLLGLHLSKQKHLKIIFLFL